MAIQVGKTNIGGWRAYILTSAPADGDGLEMSTGVPVGGTEIGLTRGDLNIKKIEEEVRLENAAQEDGVLDIYLRQNGAEVTLNFLEVKNPTILNKLLLGVTAGSDSSLSPNQTLRHGGGKHIVSSDKKNPVAFVRELAQDPGKYEFFVLYNAVAVGEKSIDWKKDDYSEVPVTFIGLTDPSRTAGKKIWLEGEED